MDGRRFDHLTKVMSADPSRRRVLRGLAGGALAAVVGRAGLGVAQAQEIGVEAFDLTCEQDDAKFYCEDPAPDVTTCGPSTRGCLCADSRQGGKKRCIQQPGGGCPKRSNKCRKDNDCNEDQVCIRVSSCCSNHPSWGKCVAKCKKGNNN